MTLVDLITQMFFLKTFDTYEFHEFHIAITFMYNKHQSSKRQPNEQPFLSRSLLEHPLVRNREQSERLLLGNVNSTIDRFQVECTSFHRLDLKEHELCTFAPPYLPIRTERSNLAHAAPFNSSTKQGIKLTS